MPLSNYTISMQSGVIESTSVYRKTLTSFLLNVGNMKEKSDGILGVATGTTDMAIPLNALTTAQFVFIISDIPVTIKFNGDTNGVLIGDSGGGREGALIVFGDSITGITVSNSSGNEARVEYILGGI